MHAIAIKVNKDQFRSATAGLTGHDDFVLTVAEDGRIWIDGKVIHNQVRGKPVIPEVKEA